MELRSHTYNIEDEVLEILWIKLEEGGLETVPVEEIHLEEMAPVSVEVLQSLKDKGLIVLEESQVKLTDPGFEEARKTIRRHRLSERMFADIFDVVHEDMEDAACRFEHMLIKADLEEKICQMLGHPKECPHGRAIPIGECCHRAESMIDQAVVSMNQLRQGESGVIAYVHSGDSEKLKKLMAMGILPGEPVALERRYPSFVFNVGYSRYAIDEGMAEAIFVRRDLPEER